MVYIYLLTDPQSCEPRYVGKTDDPHSRLNEHLAEARSARHSKDNTYKANWLKKLLKQNAKPDMQILEITDKDHWAEREVWWISYGRASGWRLTNLSAGGDGPGRLSEDGKARLLAAHLGKKRSPETIERLRQAALGRSPSNVTRSRISVGLKGKLKGRVFSDETKQRISDSKRGKPLTDAQRSGLRAYHAKNPGVVSGANNPHAKLTEALVVQMRKEYKQGGTSYAKLGVKYGVSTMTAHRAITGKLWSHI
jgi:hypothetical protein